MKRTYVDMVGEYYDNLDKLVDWQDEIDRRSYDISELVKSPGYLNSL